MKKTQFLYFFNDRQHFRRFLWSMSFLAFLTGIGAIFIPEAWAASFSCNGASASGNLMDQDTIGVTVNDSSGGVYTINTATATTNGDPFGTACPDSLGILGRVMCFFKSTVGQIVSSMYCGVQQKLVGPLSIALELFIVIFGVAVMTGIVKFTPRESIIALLKIALVWTFATNATWGIGIGYAFFIGVAEQGSNLVINAANTSSGGASGGGGYLTQSDSVVQGMFNLISTGSGGAGLTLPATLSTTCAIWLVAFVMILLLYMPMVAGFFVTMMIQYVMLYVRAFLGYITALVLISFLFILSPLFISFALFQVTRPMFDRWMKYLVSFSLQMIIVFSFLVLLNMIPIGAFFSEMLSLLREYDTTTVSFAFPLPATFCSVCYYTIGSGNITDATAPIVCDGTSRVHPLGELFLATDLVQAVLSQIVALWIIGTVMQDFIKQAPSFASELAGGMSFAAMLGGSQGVGGSDTAINYPGLDGIDSEENMSDLRDKIESYRSKVSTRAAPAILAGAFVAGTALSNKRTAEAAAAAAAASSGSGRSTSDKTSKALSTARSGNPAMAKAADAAKPAGPTIGRIDSVGNVLTYGKRLELAQQGLLTAQQYMAQVNSDNQGDVKDALATIQTIKTDEKNGIQHNPMELRQAQMKLDQAKVQWNAAKDSLAVANERMLNVMQEGKTGSAADAAKSSGSLSKAELKQLGNTNLDALQLQVDVQKELAPGTGTDRTAKALEKAETAFHNAKTTEEITAALAELTGVQKMLQADYQSANSDLQLADSLGTQANINLDSLKVQVDLQKKLAPGEATNEMAGELDKAETALHKARSDKEITAALAQIDVVRKDLAKYDEVIADLKDAGALGSGNPEDAAAALKQGLQRNYHDADFRAYMQSKHPDVQLPGTPDDAGLKYVSDWENRNSDHPDTLDRIAALGFEAQRMKEYEAQYEKDNGHAINQETDSEKLQAIREAESQWVIDKVVNVDMKGKWK